MSGDGPVLKWESRTCSDKTLAWEAQYRGWLKAKKRRGWLLGVTYSTHFKTWSYNVRDNKGLYITQDFCESDVEAMRAARHQLGKQLRKG